MASPHLSLDQIRFITATVAPRFGPMIDQPSLGLDHPDDVLDVAARVIATDQALNSAIVSEIYPETTAETHPTVIAVRAMQIFAATIASHDHQAILDTIGEELCRHSAVLRGEMTNG